jgi:hypothetical protein
LLELSNAPGTCPSHDPLRPLYGVFAIDTGIEPLAIDILGDVLSDVSDGAAQLRVYVYDLKAMLLCARFIAIGLLPGFMLLMAVSVRAIWG